MRSCLGFAECDPLHEFDIEPIVDSFRAQMERFTGRLHLGESYAQQTQEQKIRSGNFASRVRIAVLYDWLRSIRGRVLGTDNRTEHCQGYGTKFGTPMSYDFGVVNPLYKVDIYEIAGLLGLPQEILDAPPSTGFYEGQTHEGELGATMEEQDVIAYLLFEKWVSVRDLILHYGVDKEFAHTMLRRWEISGHKRILTAALPKVTLSKELRW